MSPYDDPRATQRATLAATDWYQRRAYVLALDTKHPEDAAIALDILTHARRAELLDPGPSPYTIPEDPRP